MAALITIAVCAAAPTAATARTRPDARAAGLSCSLASPKLVKSALGLVVGAPVVTRNGPVTVCQFETATGLLVRFETNETASLFAFGRKSFTKQGKPTRTVNGIGAKAYTASIGNTTTIVVLQHTTELLIVAQAPAAKLETLAKLILPSL